MVKERGMKALIIAFISALYLCIGSFTGLVVLAIIGYESATAETVIVALFWVFGVISCGLGFANFLLGVVRVFKPKPEPYKTVMVAKLALVPFFILNFVYLAIITLGSLNPFLFWFLPIVIFAMILTYGVLLATSAYTAGHLVYKLRQGEGSFTENIVFLVLHFIYITDVVASVVLYLKNKNNI